LARWVQNYERLQLTGAMARMETTLFIPTPDDDGAGALSVLKAIRGHIKDGADLDTKLLHDLDEMLAIVGGTRPED
jgi:hypothetical protein